MDRLANGHQFSVFVYIILNMETIFADLFYECPDFYDIPESNRAFEVAGHMNRHKGVTVQSPQEAARISADLANSGRTDLLMKGHIDTSLFMGRIVNIHIDLLIEHLPI